MDWGSHMHFMSLNIYMSFVLKDKDYNNDYNDITISFLIILTVIIMIVTMNLHMY